MTLASSSVTISSTARPELSIVSTMYHSKPFLEQFLAECLKALEAIRCSSFEIVLVDDGSPDDSHQYALSRKADIPQLVVVELSRNFGHHNAMLAGLHTSRGERVFLIDCDLEVSPSELIRLHETQHNTCADVVYGYQESRKGRWFERWSGGLFWRGFNLLSETQVPENLVTERIMTRRFVDALLTMGDRNLFLVGMMSWAGFNQVGIPVPKRLRDGSSTYTLAKRLALLVNAVSSFSAQPLFWLFYAGVTITVFSFSYGVYLVARKIIFNDTLLGFTSLMAMLVMTLGILTTAIGIVGIYLGRVFSQVQNRPTFIIKGIVR